MYNKHPGIKCLRVDVHSLQLEWPCSLTGVKVAAGKGRSCSVNVLEHARLEGPVKALHTGGGGLLQLMGGGLREF